MVERRTRWYQSLTFRLLTIFLVTDSTDSGGGRFPSFCI